MSESRHDNNCIYNVRDTGRTPELLAPAGSPEALRAALRFGADAVYIGGSFMQLRSKNVGFTDEGLAEAADIVHRAGKKLYVTVNCFAENREIEKLAPYARFLRESGVDAAIVSDIGAAAEMKEAESPLELHLSTQANCMNYRAARVYHELGIKRIVLARELSLEAIEELRAKTPASLELEAFVHGAMCMAYSGRCLISSYLASRSGNRGECAQPCRWSYSLVEDKRRGEYFNVEEDERGSAILSSHDLCMIEHLGKLRKAGVSSFKIEGRMKTPYYVATVTRAYRGMLDGNITLEAAKSELASVSHRPYSTGFYFGEEKNGHYNDGLYRSEAVIAANILACGDGFADIEQKNRFKRGDKLELLSPSVTSAGHEFEVGDMTDSEGNAVNDAPHPMQRLRIAFPFSDIAEKGDMLRMRTRGVSEE